MQSVAEQLENALIQVQEASSQIENFARNLEGNPTKMSELEERLRELHHLQRKHGKNLQEILAELAHMKKELQEIEHSDENMASLKSTGQETLEALKKLDQTLLQARKKTAAKLEVKIQKELQALSMKGCIFNISFEPLTPTKDEFPCSAKEAGLTRLGGHRVQYLIAPNQGEGLKPLHQIASGGELSRILLALKCILSPAEKTATYFFDEIDTGIGGQTALTVGRKLKDLSQDKQVVCITHLPQMASFADHHLRIAKKTQKGRTRTTIEQLSKKERIDELARMLGGDHHHEPTRKHAVDLLKQCH